MVNLQRKIKIKLITAGISGAQIAREYGVTRWAVYQVFAGRSKSPDLREFIARKLGTTAGRLWPREN